MRASTWTRLGAMLYHLLAGCRPYSGMSAASLLAEVRARPPIPLASNRARPADRLGDDRREGDGTGAVGSLSERTRDGRGSAAISDRAAGWRAPLHRLATVRRPGGTDPFAVGLGAVVATAVVFAIALFVVRQTHIRDLRETKRRADVEILHDRDGNGGATRSVSDLRRLAQRLEDAVRRASRRCRGARRPRSAGRACG